MSRTTQTIKPININKQDLIERIPLQMLVNRFTPLKFIGGGKYQGLCCFHKERSESLIIDENKDIYKCFGCGKGGKGIFNFIMNKENLTFLESLEYLSKEFNIISTEKPLIPKFKPITQKEEVLIEINECKFEKKHKDYWNKYLLPESYLRSKNIFAVKNLAYNKIKQEISSETVFGYWAEDINKWKILRIGENVTKKMKWRTNIGIEYMWYFPKEHTSDLWIVKSVKDACVLNYHFGLITSAVQNEDGIVLLSNNYERIEVIADRKIVAYGSDFQGWHESMLITEYTGWNYFNTENHLLNYNCQDISDVVAEFGLEPIRQNLIKKRFLTNN